MPRKKAAPAPEAELDQELHVQPQENLLEPTEYTPSSTTVETLSEFEASAAQQSEENHTSHLESSAHPEADEPPQPDESSAVSEAVSEQPTETIQVDESEETCEPLQTPNVESAATHEVLSIDFSTEPSTPELKTFLPEQTTDEALLPKMDEPVLAEEDPEEPAKSDRQLFFELDFRELDRRLTPEERQEWNSIYASYRGRSALSGAIIGVDRLSLMVYNADTDEMERKDMYCAIVVPYRVRIVIPATEMWDDGAERPNFVLQNMVGAHINFIVIKVDREGGFAIASRRRASRVRRLYFSRRPALQGNGARIQCQVLAVGPRRCLVECYGHDINLTQRELRYTAIPDLRNEYHPGQELDCVVKEYDADSDTLEISVKEIESNPFDGADVRHPVGSRRQATIAGKYGGGVFCNLTDGTVCMCNYSYQYEDSDFMVGDTVILVIQRHEVKKRQIYGKILSKW